jgi:hypothetical protein
MTETRIRNHTVETISEGFAPLRRHEFELLRRDGTWDRQVREIYERDDAAAVLPYDPGRGTVLLVRQFRMPVHVHGDKADLIETCAGLLEGRIPKPASGGRPRRNWGFACGRSRPSATSI